MVARVTRSPGGVFRRSPGGVRGISAPLVFGTAYYHGSCVLSDVFFMWRGGVVYYSENFGGTWSVLEDAAALNEFYAYTVVSDTLYTTQPVSGSASTFHTSTDCTSLTAVGAPSAGFVAQNDIGLSGGGGTISAGTYDGTSGDVYRLSAVNRSVRKNMAYFDDKFWGVCGPNDFQVWIPPWLEYPGYWSNKWTLDDWLSRTSNGTYWTFAKENPYEDISAMCVYDGKLFCLATIYSGFSRFPYGFYTTNGTTITTMSPGAVIENATVPAVPNCVPYGDDLYIIPYRANTYDHIPRVAIYDGTSWTSEEMVGVPADGQVIYNGFVYDGKIFVTRWDEDGGEVYLHAYYSTDGENWTHA